MAEWSPWQTLEVLRQEIDRVFDENGSRRAPASWAAFLPGQAARRYPLINLYEALLSAEFIREGGDIRQAIR